MRTKCMGPDDMITSLSGGNQQKLILCKWLLMNPKVLILDEPTSSLNDEDAKMLLDLLMEFKKTG